MERVTFQPMGRKQNLNDKKALFFCNESLSAIRFCTIVTFILGLFDKFDHIIQSFIAWQLKMGEDNGLMETRFKFYTLEYRFNFPGFFLYC